MKFLVQYTSKWHMEHVVHVHQNGITKHITRVTIFYIVNILLNMDQGIAVFSNALLKLFQKYLLFFFFYHIMSCMVVFYKKINTYYSNFFLLFNTALQYSTVQYVEVRLGLLK